jgi:regulator of ribonuclease activity A
MGNPFSTADLHDMYPDRCASCETQFRQYGGCRIIAGRIRTVKCLNDNVVMRRVLESHSEGDVLVVDSSGYLGSALIGDTIAEIGLNNGWSGVVINGAVRDVSALAQLKFGVKALGSNPKKSEKLGIGQIDTVLSFGGVVFTPGQWLYSDDDGLLVSQDKLV